MDLNTTGTKILTQTLHDKIVNVIFKANGTDTMIPIKKKEVSGNKLNLYVYLNESYVGIFEDFRFADENGIALTEREPGENDLIKKDGSAGFLKSFTITIKNI